MRGFSEREWKILRRLKPLALERLTWRILEGAQEIIASAEEGQSYDAYLKLYRYIQEQDAIVADCFDDWRRANAIFFLLHWRRQGLITDEEFQAFTPETRDTIDFLLMRQD